MTDFDVGNQKACSVKGIDDAILSDPQPTKTLPLGGEQLSLERVLKETLNGFDDVPLSFSVNAPELSESTSFPPDLNQGRGHASPRRGQSTLNRDRATG